MTGSMPCLHGKITGTGFHPWNGRQEERERQVKIGRFGLSSGSKSEIYKSGHHMQLFSVCVLRIDLLKEKRIKWAKSSKPCKRNRVPIILYLSKFSQSILKAQLYPRY